MGSVERCRQVAKELLGSSIRSVEYVGIDYDGLDVPWSFDDWQCPEVAVEIETDEGEVFYATWDSSITRFELTLESGPFPDRMHPEIAQASRRWSAETTDIWKPMIGTPISAVDVVSSPDTSSAAVAIRMQVARRSVWMAAAMPEHETGKLDERSVWLGGDELIVLRDDAAAKRIGLAVEELTDRQDPSDLD